MDTSSMGCKKMILETNPHNPRTISKDSYEKLKASIERNPDGLTANKIAYKDGIIISGNQRYRAILELGLTIKPEWLKDLSGWTQEQIDEWIIQSNISAGEWDWDILANEWEADTLIDWGIDMPDDWGSTKELPEDIDDIPEVKTPVSKLGDLWLLDGHRVLCGDSTDKTTVERLMDGKKADMVFTDPPYGMNLDTDYSKMANSKSLGKPNNFNEVIGDDQPFNFQPFAWIECKEQIWFGANYYAKTLPDCGSWLVWDKRVEEKFDRMFGSGFEIAWSKTPHKQKIYRHNNTLFGGDSEARGKEHPTQKPTKLLIEMMDDMVKDAKAVLDLFLGSGSTLIACEQTDRTCYGIELDPHYVDVICKRWQTLTGQMPILESTGETHDFSS